MEIKTGKIFLLNLFILIFIFFKIFSNEPTVGHKLLSQKGILIKSPIVGEPFLLELTVHDANFITGFDVENINQFKIRDFRRITNQSIINGIKKETKSFTYSLIAEKSGVFKLGPITLKADDKIVTTQTFNIIVKEGELEGQFKSSSNPVAKLKMFIDDKKKIFVGQKIPLKVRFYYNSDDINCEAVSQVVSDDFVLGSYDGPYEGYENINNQNFKYLEWTYDIFAKQSGKLELLPLKASYSLSNSDNMYSVALRMFGVAQESKTIESDPITVKVFDIPENPGFKGAIGKFTNLILTSTADKFLQASPIILKLQITGEGNLENLKWPKLNLPSVIRVTESKNYFDGSLDKMTFEYILQIMQEGNYSIGPEKITYFDPESESFKLLKSNILKFVIEPSRENIIYEDELDKFLKDYDKNFINKASKNDKILENKFNFAILPNNLFLILFLGPLIILLFIILYLLIFNNYKYIYNFILFKTAFILSKLKIKLYRKNNRPDKIYEVFDNLFKHRLPSYSVINAGQEVENILKSEEKIKDWHNFYLVILSYKFSETKVNLPKDWFFDKASYWLNELEKLI